MKKVLLLVLFGILSLCTLSCDSATDQEGCLIGNPDKPDYMGTLNGYEIYRNGGGVCDMVVGRIIVDGYDFGSFSWGCAADLNNIGYEARKMGTVFQLQDLVDRKKLTTKEFYEKIYVCDDEKIGIYE